MGLSRNELPMVEDVSAGRYAAKYIMRFSAPLPTERHIAYSLLLDSDPRSCSQGCGIWITLPPAVAGLVESSCPPCGDFRSHQQFLQSLWPLAVTFLKRFKFSPPLLPWKTQIRDSDKFVNLINSIILLADHFEIAVRNPRRSFVWIFTFFTSRGP